MADADKNIVCLTENQLVLIDEGNRSCDMCTAIYSKVYKENDRYFIDKSALSENQIKHLDEMNYDPEQLLR